MRKILLLLFSISSLQAQEKISVPDKNQELSPSAQEFMKLPEEQRKQFGELYNKANKLLQEKRIFEALSTLDKAEKIFGNLTLTLSLRASCYVEMRDFEKARALFEKIQELEPKNLANQFNIAEMHFVCNEWQLAHDLFNSLLADETTDNQNMTPILDFKLLICKTKLNRKEEASVLSKKYSSKDDTPFYYYAQALAEYEANDTVKAEVWTAKAANIFRNNSILYPWQDSLEEARYLAVPLDQNTETK